MRTVLKFVLLKLNWQKTFPFTVIGGCTPYQPSFLVYETSCHQTFFENVAFGLPFYVLQNGQQLFRNLTPEVKYDTSEYHINYI